MYRGFKLLDIEFEDIDYFDYCVNIGKELYESNKVLIKESLELYTSPDDILDGSQMEKDWFPLIKADVFISHSHGDEIKAIAIAGWLKDRFRIKAFIDSCIWNHADKLLRIIDDKCCVNTAKTAYDYTLRNYSTSHVHMMLSTALSKMIDKTESLFFLETKNSTIKDGIKTKSLSPWIYSEIAISKIIQKKLPDRYDRVTMMFSDGGVMRNLNEAINITHDLDLNHLTEINNPILQKWSEKKIYLPNLALDKLYELLPIKKTNKII